MSASLLSVKRLQWREGFHRETDGSGRKEWAGRRSDLTIRMSARKSRDADTFTYQRKLPVALLLM